MQKVIEQESANRQAANVREQRLHSSRSASIGSGRAARMAGNTLAHSDTPASRATAIPIVKGSWPVKPNSMDLVILVPLAAS